MLFVDKATEVIFITKNYYYLFNLKIILFVIITGNTDVKDVDHKPVRCGGVLEGNSHPTEGKYSYTGLLKTG